MVKGGPWICRSESSSELKFFFILTIESISSGRPLPSKPVKTINMPKLYYTPTSCGAASFISAYVAGVKIDCEEVALATHTTASGADFYSINPKGNVPAIVLDDGTVLNENAATLQWVADQAPGTVAPEFGTNARYEVIAALSYISSEFHGTIGGLFYPASEEVHKYIREKLAKKFSFLESNLIGQKEFIVGNKFSIADAYLYICLTWTAYLQIDLSPYPNTKAYLERIGALEKVAAAKERLATKPTTTID